MNHFISSIMPFINAHNIITAIGIGFAIPVYIDKVKKAKGKNLYDKIRAVAITMIPQLVDSVLSNGSKKAVVENAIYNQLPANYQKYITQEVINEIIEGVYHASVKNKEPGTK